MEWGLHVATVSASECVLLCHPENETSDELARHPMSRTGRIRDFLCESSGHRRLMSRYFFIFWSRYLRGADDSDEWRELYA